MTSATAITQPKAPLTGFGGWLIWLAIGQALAIPRMVQKLVAYYGDESTPAMFQATPVAMYGELILWVCYLVLVIYTTGAFFYKKRAFKRAFTIQSLSLLAFGIIDLIWISAVDGVPLAAMINEGAGQLGSAVGATIGMIPWVAYVWRSRRVANTFVN